MASRRAGGDNRRAGGQEMVNRRAGGDNRRAGGDNRRAGGGQHEDGIRRRGMSHDDAWLGLVLGDEGAHVLTEPPWTRGYEDHDDFQTGLCLIVASCPSVMR
jgi:hypothetical protein